MGFYHWGLPLVVHCLCAKPAVSWVQTVELNITKNRFGRDEVQLSEIELFGADGIKLDVMAIRNPGGSSPHHQQGVALIDGQNSTKWLDASFLSNGYSLLEMDVEADVAVISSYQLVTANDVAARDPVQWSIHVRTTCGERLTVIDGYTDASFATANIPRQSAYCPGACPLPQVVSMVCPPPSPPGLPPGPKLPPDSPCSPPPPPPAPAPPVGELVAVPRHSATMSSQYSDTSYLAPACAPRLHTFSAQSHQSWTRYFVRLNASWMTPISDSLLRICSARLHVHTSGSNFSASVWNQTTDLVHGQWFVERDRAAISECHRHVRGPVILLNTWWPGEFSHWMYDWIPLLVKAMVLAPGWPLILPKSAIAHDWISSFVPYDVARHSVWLNRKETTCVDHGDLAVILSSAKSPIQRRRPMSTYLAHRYVRRSPLGLRQTETSLRDVIYCSRTYHVAHGRRIPMYHERDIITLIGRVLRLQEFKALPFKLRRSRSALVVLGQRKDQLSLLAQMHMFQNARTIIGPHGGALANSLWTRGDAALIEFVCSAESIIQDGCPWGRSYVQFTACAPWIRFHIVPFASNSTSTVSYINLGELELALKAIDRQ
mmetsp:Transcript_13260/g.33995  ORF Transcript_13260/g.33995 Transcript_13260/m.33995 type:complete len:602 (-) Transcript_13260:203-2008(-)